MKSVLEIISQKETEVRQREHEIQQLRQELQTLQLAARVMSEDADAEVHNGTRVMGAALKQFP